MAGLTAGRLLDQDLSIDQGELTPSLKIKRKVVESKYRTLLGSMYGETAAPMAK